MDIKQYKDSRNIPSLTKVKDLCKLLFQEVPTNLTEAQVVALDEALKNASDTAQKQLPPGDSVGKLEIFGENKIERNPTAPESLAIDHKIIQIMGQRALIKNRYLYGEFAKLALQKSENIAYTLAFQLEQRFYAQIVNTEAKILSESQNRIQQVVDGFNSWDSFKDTCRKGLDGDTEDDLLLYEAAIAIFDELGL